MLFSNPCISSFNDGFGKTFYFYSNFGGMKKEERVKTARK